jgi:7,8-dihydropterin-6-yl-methyl-4-(beta-D-ribofuranosyl)aminobenzene 5'-phosphate synthase
VTRSMASTIRVTVLVENTAQGARLLGEHGLAYWLEWEDRQVLLDTGQGVVLAGNAYKLNVPLHQAEAVILSHGHYDHSGGLGVVLRSPRTVVYAHPAAMQPKFARRREGAARDIGIPPTSQRAIASTGSAFVATTVPTPVLERLTVAGPALWNAFPGRCTTCHVGNRFEFEVP